MLGDTLAALHCDLVEGRVSAVRANDPFVEHYFTGTWRGIKNTAIRYDCVTFYLEKGDVEARISRIPKEQADQVREIWMLVSPSFSELKTVWQTVLGYSS